MEMLIVGMKEADGQIALEDIDDARSDKEIKLDDLALVYRNKKGKVKIRQTRDATIGKGLGRGGTVGLLIGIATAIVNPVAGLATAAAWTVGGAAVGGVIAAFDDGVDNPMMRKLGASLDMHESVLIALGEKPEIAKLEEGFAPYAGELEYEVVPEATQDLIKELAKLSADDRGAA